MIRLNLLLTLIVVLCSLGVVTSQHKARQIFTELQTSQEAAKQLEIEYGQLQLEQSTWSMHSRIETVASKELGMRAPHETRIRLVPPAEAIAQR